MSDKQASKGITMTTERDYEVTAEVTISVSKTIRAGSLEEAQAKAEELRMPSLCWTCASAGEDDRRSWELGGEFDGDAKNVRVVDPLAARPKAAPAPTAKRPRRKR